jgi:predicted AAA+ superfamily ATPase
MKNYVQTYVFRDLRELGVNISTELLQKLLEMLTMVHGNMLSMAGLARSLGVTSPTVARYIDVLEGSFLIRLLQPYSVNISKRLVKSPKFYFCDSGMFHYLSKIQAFENLLGHIFVGASWEGYVIEQVIRQVSDDWQFFFYRTHAGVECDLFGISPEGKRICIEIKRSNSPTVSKGFYESIKDLAINQTYVIIPSGESYTKNDGIQIMNLPDFLTELTPIT